MDIYSMLDEKSKNNLEKIMSGETKHMNKKEKKQ